MRTTTTEGCSRVNIISENTFVGYRIIRRIKLKKESEGGEQSEHQRYPICKIRFRNNNFVENRRSFFRLFILHPDTLKSRSGSLPRLLTEKELNRLGRKANSFDRHSFYDNGRLIGHLHHHSKFVLHTNPTTNQPTNHSSTFMRLCGSPLGIASCSRWIESNRSLFSSSIHPSSIEFVLWSCGHSFKTKLVELLRSYF